MRNPGIGHNRPPPTARAEMSLRQAAIHLITAIGHDMTGTMSIHEKGAATVILSRMYDKTVGKMSDGRPAIWMTDTTLSNVLGVSPKQASRYVLALKKHGVLIVERGDKRTGKATLYAPGDLAWMPHFPDGCINWGKVMGTDQIEEEVAGADF